MSDINEEQKRLYKRAEENDYYFKKNNELSALNTSLRSQRDNLQNRINKALEILDKIQFFTTPIGQVIHLNMIISDIRKVKSILKGDNK